MKACGHQPRDCYPEQSTTVLRPVATPRGVRQWGVFAVPPRCLPQAQYRRGTRATVRVQSPGIGTHACHRGRQSKGVTVSLNTYRVVITLVVMVVLFVLPALAAAFAPVH